MAIPKLNPIADVVIATTEESLTGNRESLRHWAGHLQPADNGNWSVVGVFKGDLYEVEQETEAILLSKLIQIEALLLRTELKHD